MKHLRLALLATSALVPLSATLVFGNPIDPMVNAGDVSIEGLGSGSVTVNQSSDKAIIDWRSFDIGIDESTHFTQPSSSAVVLNRVTGGEGASQILGTLRANGQVFLVNPDGILIGKNAKIDVGALVATTHDLLDGDFLSGNYEFGLSGKPDASVINLGTITVSDTGFAALVAPGVRNAGTITANLGRVSLASASSFSLDLYGDSLVKLGLSDEVAGQVIDLSTGKPLNALVGNDGLLRADGGTVQLTAAATREVIDAVVNNTGLIEANTVAMHHGKIVLSAATADTKPADAPAQKVKVSGMLSASGADESETGGAVEITAEHIALVEATIDAFGWNGGGTVLIGGDLGARRPNSSATGMSKADLGPLGLATATTVTFDSASIIDVSSKQSGTGGSGVVWSRQQTAFHGTIFARGGSQSGSGGFVETSGGDLDVTGARVDTSAPLGHPGQWLLDPTSLVIGTALANTISSNLASTNVTLSADQYLELGANIIKSAGPDATLTFIAPWINQLPGVSVVSTSGKLNVAYDASDRVWFGRPTLADAVIVSNNGNITLHGSHFVGVSGAVNAGFGAVLIRSEDPFGGPPYDRGIWVIGNSVFTGSRITIDSPLKLIEPGVQQIIRTVSLPPPFIGPSAPPIDWAIAGSTPAVISVTPTSPEAVEAIDLLLGYATVCADKCLTGIGTTALLTAITQVFELSGVVPKLTTEPTTYRFIRGGISIAITLVGVTAGVVAGAPAAAVVGVAGVVFVLTELTVRPIVGSE